MTPLSLILAYFPALVLGLAGMTILWLCAYPSILGVVSVGFVLYGLPLVAYRLHHLRYPVQPGVSYLRGQDYSPWWGSHQLQMIYITFPGLEALLRLVPGLFSVWLRLWGAKVGQSVYWTPGLEIADRGLLEIGDRVVLGHRTGLYSHVIKPRKDNLMLYVKPITIGNDVFIGAGSVLGPGVSIADRVYLPAGTQLHPNQKVTPCDGSFKASGHSSPPSPSDLTMP